jgi:ComF family protein
MFLTQSAQLVYDALLTLAYPQICVICGQSVEQRRFGVACKSCWKETRIFTDGEADRVSPEFTVARAVGIYEGALRESVLLLKRQPFVPRHVQRLLADAASREPFDSGTRVVPVPLHPRRLKTRGFNQAAILGSALSKEMKLPLDEVSLLRVTSTEKYRAGLDRKGRRDTVAGAFEVAHPRLVAGENILLVDDVFTTGATVSACTEALLTARAANVFVLTLARAFL